MMVGESEPKGLGTLCRLLGYTRQAYYKKRRHIEQTAFESELVLQEVARLRLRQKRIGTRKLHHLLLAGFLSEQGKVIGRDRLFDLLREHQLLVRRRRRKCPRTTFSLSWTKRYPNLAKGFVPTRADQLWVSDITYVRIGEGFAYLSLVTDAYSRKIVGYHLSRDLAAKGCVRALKMALRDNPVRDGLIHHSDRGLQYYSRGYMKLLAGIRISMTERGDPLENAIAERVNGILKQELLEKSFSGFREARESVNEAVSVYNHLRPHLSCDMLTPSEAHHRSGELKRRWKNYYQGRTLSQASA